MTATIASIANIAPDTTRDLTALLTDPGLGLRKYHRS
jgi:hypothetical protein